ncbi:hypothetical protein J3R83DRAFT_13444 [Lanmaoa asiatica]|nr:hypothetical protein J3R83DRAFT_13444 [Lanmaoa asiatica]
MSASASTSGLPPLSTQQPTLFTPWNPLGPPLAGSTNDRRVDRHRQSLSNLRRVQLRRSTPSSRLPRGVSSRKYIVVIHPEPVYGTVSTQSGSTFSVLREPATQKMTGFLEQAISLDLVFKFECCADDETPAGRQLNNAVCSHLSRYSFRFSQALPLDGGSMDLPRSLTRTIPSASSTPLPDVHTLPNSSEDDYEWNFLVSRKGQRKEAVGAKLTSSSKPAKEITFSELDKIGSRVPRPPAPYQEFVVFFIQPTGRNLVVGPLQGQGNNYLCLAMHLWNGFMQTSFDEVRRSIECSNECFQSSVPPWPLSAQQLQEPPMSLIEPPARESQPHIVPARPLSPSLSPPLTLLSCLPMQPEQPYPPSPSGAIMPPNESELQTVSAAEALHAWRRQIDHAISMATEPFTFQETRVRIRTETPGDAAQGFFDSCVSWCESALGLSVLNICAPSHLLLELRLKTVILQRSPSTMSVGDSIVQSLATSRRRWVLYTHCLLPSNEDLQAFRAYGLVLRTGLIWGMDLLPISPALICYLISNYPIATNPAFLKVILPQTFARLATWPPPLINDGVTGSSHLRLLPATDPYTMILKYDENILINQLRNLSPAQCDILLQEPTQPVTRYTWHLALAFNDPSMGSSGISSTNFIIGLFRNRTVSSVDQIIGLLRPTTPAFTSDSTGFNPTLDYPALAIKWTLHLKRYLGGIGVPRGPDHAFLFDEEDNQDPMFRSKLFLQCITGNTFLPVDPLQKISGLHVHTSFFTIDVILNAETTLITDQDVLADVSVATDFDRWLHSAIGSTASSVYNTA